MTGTHRDMRGFEYLMYSAVSFVLLCVLVLLPIAPAFASEEVSGGADTEAVESIEVTPDVEESTPVSFQDEAPSQAETTEALPEQDSGVEETSSELDIVLSEPEPAPDAAPTAEAESQSADTVIEISDTEPLEEASVSLEIPEEESQDDPDEIPVVPDNIPRDEILHTEDTEPTPEEENPTSDVFGEGAFNDAVSEVLPEDSAGMEDEVVPTEETRVVLDTIGGNSNLFSFRKEECIAVGDSSFYCSTASTAPAVVGMDRVFAAVDADGDKEIYIEKGGELIPITQNLFDDEAPYYDEYSESIVWHRLIDGRYQIVSFDLDEGEETILTNDHYNNMEPSRYGDITVWQGWVGNDWEIMLMEGKNITMLTDNTYGDVAPSINGTYIVWQSFEEGAWRVKVYDTVTEEVTIIDDAEGASVENPRFVLVYDTKQNNGDVETRGYDLERKIAVPLGSRPAPVPESIPDPEQTGEDRALLQTITQVKPKGEDDADLDTDDEPLPFGDTSTTTDSTISDVVIPSLTEVTEEGIQDNLSGGEDTIQSNSDFVNPTDHIEDIIISPTETSEDTSATEHIEDIVVTPFVEPISKDSVDSQSGVATSS